MADKENEGVITARLPRWYVNKMDQMITDGYARTRSEVIRDAMKNYFKKSR